MAGMIGLLLAQTTHDDGVDNDKLSNDTAKEKGLFGSRLSLGDLGSIGGFVGGITALVVAIVAGIYFLIRPANSEYQTTLIRILESSANIDNLLKDNESEEFSRVEKVVLNVEGSHKASFVEKTAADAYRLQQNGKINEARQKWHAIAEYAERKNNTLAKHSGVSIGYLLPERTVVNASQSKDPNLKFDDTDAHVYRGLGKYASEGIVIGAVLRYFNGDKFNRFSTILEYNIGSGSYRADVGLLTEEGKLAVLVECKRIGHATKAGIAILNRYIRVSDVRFGILAADTDPSKWAFLKMLENEIHEVKRSQFEEELGGYGST